jgi:hypothetical protein
MEYGMELNTIIDMWDLFIVFCLCFFIFHILILSEMLLFNLVYHPSPMIAM